MMQTPSAERGNFQAPKRNVDAEGEAEAQGRAQGPQEGAQAPLVASRSAPQARCATICFQAAALSRFARERLS